MTAPKKLVDNLNGASKVAFRFGLHISDGPELSGSPWSDYFEVKDGKIAPMYFGDGYAAVDTLRKVYMRTADTDVNGVEVVWLTGHGILIWPEDKSAVPV